MSLQPDGFGYFKKDFNYNVFSECIFHHGSPRQPLQVNEGFCEIWLQTHPSFVMAWVVLAWPGLCLRCPGMCLGNTGLCLVQFGVCRVVFGVCRIVFGVFWVVFGPYRAVFGL